MRMPALQEQINLFEDWKRQKFSPIYTAVVGEDVAAIEQLIAKGRSTNPHIGMQMTLLLFVAGLHNFTEYTPDFLYTLIEKDRPLYPWHPRITRPVLEQLCVDLRGADPTDLASVPEAARKPLQLFMIGIVYKRAVEMCVAMHQLDLPALVMCHIVEAELGSTWTLVPWHVYWNIVVAVKHFFRK